MTEKPQERLIIGDWGRKLGWCTSTFCGPGVVANGTLAAPPGGGGVVNASNKCAVALAAACSAVATGDTTASVLKCDACAGKHQKSLKRAGCTAPEVQSWCTTPVLDFGAWGRTSNATTLPLKTGTLLASFSDGRPAISQHAIGSGHNVHFFWFPGMSHVNQAISQYGRLTPFQPGSEGANFFPGISNGSRLTTEIALARILDSAGSQPRVRCDSGHVETPLLEADAGSVITVLKWLNTTQAAGPQPMLLTCNVSLGFSPATVTSTELGTLVKRRNADRSPSWSDSGKPGEVSFRVSIGVADILSFHKQP